MTKALKPIGSAKQRKLSAEMTRREFDNGYWYAEELRAFAVELKIPLASKLRKDQLEAAIKGLLFSKGAKAAVISVTPKEGPRDLDRGLRLDLPVVHYTSNRETKASSSGKRRRYGQGLSVRRGRGICSIDGGTRRLPRGARSPIATWYCRRSR